MIRNNVSFYIHPTSSEVFQQIVSGGSIGQYLVVFAVAALSQVLAGLVYSGKVVEVIRNLWIEQVVWMSEDDEEVSKYIPRIKVGWVRVKLPAEYERIRDEIKGMIEALIRKLQVSGLTRMPVEAVNRKVLVGLMNRLRAEIDTGLRGPTSTT